MAGKGQRFREAGYKIPKYQIKVHQKTLFEWSMSSLEYLRPVINKYLFVTRKEDKSKDFIIQKCSELDISEYEIIELDFTTDGQATTAYSALKCCDINSSLLIYNIDTFVKPNCMDPRYFGLTAHIPCFESPGENWSFVKINELGFADEVSEKKRISDNCSVGAYYFPSVILFKSAYESYYNDDSSGIHREKYIAPIYNNLIQNEVKVTIHLIDSSNVFILGTPEELLKFGDTEVIELIKATKR